MPEPHCFRLVDQTIILRAEAWESGACAATDDWFAGSVAALGYNLKYVHLWSRIARNHTLFHNAFEIKLLNYSGFLLCWVSVSCLSWFLCQKCDNVSRYIISCDSCRVEVVLHVIRSNRSQNIVSLLLATSISACLG